MLLQWIIALLVLIPFFLFLSVLIPSALFLFAIFWFLSLGADLRSTHKFYQECPKQFRQNERNKFFVLFTEKLGFKKASAIFPLIFEVPLILFFALFPLQVLYSYAFNNASSNFPACLATSLGIAGAGHMQAVFTNHHFKAGKNASSERRYSLT